MTVYVDDVRLPFGRMIMCHMWADSTKQLLEMADKIGVDRKWIQGHPKLSFGKHKEASWVHFDVSLACKAKAIYHGAVLTDKYGPVVHTTKKMLKWAKRHNHKEVAANAREKLRIIKELRERLS